MRNINVRSQSEVAAAVAAAAAAAEKNEADTSAFSISNLIVMIQGLYRSAPMEELKEAIEKKYIKKIE